MTLALRVRLVRRPQVSLEDEYLWSHRLVGSQAASNSQEPPGRLPVGPPSQPGDGHVAGWGVWHLAGSHLAMFHRLGRKFREPGRLEKKGVNTTRPRDQENKNENTGVSTRLHRDELAFGIVI